MIIDSFRELNCRIWWGEGKKHSSFIAVYDGHESHQFFSIYPTSKSIKVEIQFMYMKAPYNTSDSRMKIKNKLEYINGISIDESRINKRPSFELDILSGEVDIKSFVDVFKSIIEDINEYDKLS